MSTKKIQIISSVVHTDTTLAKEGFAADAKAVGDAITEIESNLLNIEDVRAEVQAYVDEAILGGAW